jgi:Fe-S cluster biogenesis protein NfuA
MTFSDEDIYEAVKHHLPTVNDYIASHGGTIRLLGVKDGKVYIELAGACHGCSMSLMTTKMVVQKKLRELIHPELTVINVDGTPENALPEEGLYIPEEDIVEEEDQQEEESLWDKAKRVFSKGEKDEI